MTILLTGAAGFIGAYVARGLLARGESVVGIDNFNDYYDPQLKRDRVSALCRGLDLQTLDVADKPALDALFAKTKIHQVVHLAAQAGVRYSLKNPYAYLHSNWTGFLNILAKTSAVAFSNQRTVSSYIRSVRELRGDRFFAVVDKALREETKNSALDGSSLTSREVEISSLVVRKQSARFPHCRSCVVSFSIADASTVRPVRSAKC